jgi:hypothetical protein
MNARTQITLGPELQRRARKKAAGLGISFAEYVRRVVANDLGGAPKQADVTALFDLGTSGSPTDIAKDKDRLIGEAVWAEYKRKTKRRHRRR